MNRTSREDSVAPHHPAAISRKLTFRFIEPQKSSVFIVDISAENEELFQAGVEIISSRLHFTAFI